MAREGKVYVQNKYAGQIKETDQGYEFIYDKAYLEKEDALPVSLTLPLREEPYVSNMLFPFFDGLIPEGWLLHGEFRHASEKFFVDGRSPLQQKVLSVCRI